MATLKDKNRKARNEQAHAEIRAILATKYNPGDHVQYPEIRNKLDYRYTPVEVAKALQKLCKIVGRDKHGGYTVYEVVELTA